MKKLFSIIIALIIAGGIFASSLDVQSLISEYLGQFDKKPVEIVEPQEERAKGNPFTEYLSQFEAKTEIVVETKAEEEKVYSFSDYLNSFENLSNTEGKENDNSSEVMTALPNVDEMGSEKTKDGEVSLPSFEAKVENTPEKEASVKTPEAEEPKSEPVVQSTAKETQPTAKVSVEEVKESVTASAGIKNTAVKEEGDRKRTVTFETILLAGNCHEIDSRFGASYDRLGLGISVGARDLLRLGDYFAISIKGIWARSLSIAPTIDIKAFGFRAYIGFGFCLDGTTGTAGVYYETKDGYMFGIDYTSSYIKYGESETYSIIVGKSF